MSGDTNNGDKPVTSEPGAIVPAPPPPAMEGDAPVNWTPPRPPPRRDAPTSGPEILVPGSAPRPRELLHGADMGDDRVYTGNLATGKVRIYRRQASWTPDNPTSRQFNLLLNEIRRLRVKAREPEFDN